MLILIISVIYFVCAVLLCFYAGASIVLLLTYLRHRHDKFPIPTVERWPTLVVQLPIYNELYVVERLIKAVSELDYPKELITVQVLDDSTDDTPELVSCLVKQLQETGLNIQHVQRELRTGYKAGALAYGLSLVDCELVFVLDADFTPPADFLRRTVPYFMVDPTLGMVQTRWGHRNPFENLLTMGQALALDGYFVVEQTARNRAGWPINFNGSGGIWRVETIREAGGWSDTTLTEDLDLSYRAQLAGWHFLYLPDIEVPGELPPQIAAYKQQQARWAKGSTQTLVRMLKPIWQSKMTHEQRIMATVHLCHYMLNPLMMLLLLLTPPLILTNVLHHIPIPPLGLAGMAPPLIYVISQLTLYTDWWRRLMAFPMLLILGMGMAWNNSCAVAEGLIPGSSTEFLRTPKFPKNLIVNTYALKFDRSVAAEIALAIYAAWGLWLATKMNRGMVPYMALSSAAFSTMALWGLWDQWILYQRRGR